MTLPRDDWNVESPFMLLTGLELGPRVIDAYRFEHSIIRWCGGAEYHGHRLLKLWAEDCFRYWWHHV